MAELNQNDLLNALDMAMLADSANIDANGYLNMAGRSLDVNNGQPCWPSTSSEDPQVSTIITSPLSVDQSDNTSAPIVQGPNPLLGSWLYSSAPTLTTSAPVSSLSLPMPQSYSNPPAPSLAHNSTPRASRTFTVGLGASGMVELSAGGGLFTTPTQEDQYCVRLARISTSCSTWPVSAMQLARTYMTWFGNAPNLQRLIDTADFFLQTRQLAVLSAKTSVLNCREASSVLLLKAEKAEVMLSPVALAGPSVSIPANQMRVTAEQSILGLIYSASLSRGSSPTEIRQSLSKEIGLDLTDTDEVAELLNTALLGYRTVAHQLLLVGDIGLFGSFSAQRQAGDMIVDLKTIKNWLTWTTISGRTGD